MIKKAYRLEKYSEIWKQAKKVSDMKKSGKPKLFTNEQKQAEWEAQYNLNNESLWKEMAEYVKQYFKETLTGDWYLVMLDDEIFIEQDSIHGY